MSNITTGRGRIPGPVCQIRNWYDINDGTMARVASPTPGALNNVGEADDDPNQPVVLTGEQLTMIVPTIGNRAERVANDLNTGLRDAGITTRIGQAMFIAQLAHESAGFSRLEEMGGKTKYTNAKYKEKEADDQVYDYFFFMYDKDSPSPRRRKVAEGLGNSNKGDGALFKGRGYIQLTGRSNYRAAGGNLGLELEKNPALAADSAVAARVAGWYWRTRKLNRYTSADSAANFKAVTIGINGGTNGLPDRQVYYNRAKFILLQGEEGP